MPDRLRAALQRRDGVHLVPYLMAGFPSGPASVELGRRYAAAGAAAIEIGVPFSDPLADGPVIQRAGKAALDGGMTLAGALRVAAEVSEGGPPVVLMTYLNPVLSYGVEHLAKDAAAAGVAGIIVPDLPVDEAAAFLEPLREQALDTVFLVAPTSSADRIAAVGEQSRGFVYCVTVTGVTGARNELGPGLFDLLQAVRAHTDIPVAAGFGISRPEHVQALRGHVEAAVVASALMSEVLEGRDPGPLLHALVAAGQ
ncbi:MAG: tryptophan synthase subunit alpha [Candidatus Dormiibacterota bacterium]